MRRWVWSAALLATLFVAGAALSGCCGLLSAKKDSGDDTGAPKSSAAVLAKFFDASMKSGTFDITTIEAEGGSKTEQAEFWVSGSKFRIDYFRDGKQRISIRCADGKTAYFCYPDKKIAEPSVATPEVYLRKFTRPETAGTSEGVDAATGAEKIRYVVKQTSDVPGSTNKWYVEDLVYFVKDGKLLQVVDRGGIPHAGEETKLDTHATVFTKLETGAEIPADTFEIPYPIQAAK